MILVSPFSKAISLCLSSNSFSRSLSSQLKISPISRSPLILLSKSLLRSFPTPCFYLAPQAITSSTVHLSASASSSTTAMAGHASLPHVPCGCLHAQGGPPFPHFKKMTKFHSRVLFERPPLLQLIKIKR